MDTDLPKGDPMAPLRYGNLEGFFQKKVHENLD